MGEDNEVGFEVVNAVNNSWNTIKKIPNHVEIAGELLFRKIFEIAPPALGMFSFGPEFADDEEKLYQSAKFKRHAAGVVTMLDAAVNMLGPDLEPATKALTRLGAVHIAFGVLPAHYGIVGEALVHTLKTALGEGWTPLVAKGWTMIFGFVSTAMMAGATNELEKQIRRKDRIAQRKRKTKVPSIHDEFNMKAEEGPGDEAIQTVEEEERKKSTSELLLDITGKKPSEPSKQMQKLTDLIDDILVIDSSALDDDDLSLTSIGSDPAEPIKYSEMVESVYTTWHTVTKIPNYTEVAGVLLFQNIFEIAPEARGLFPFAEEYGEDPEGLIFKDPTFLKHAKSVVAMLDVAVNMLGPDLEPVTEALEDLGARHCQYGVLPAHYAIVGEALLKTLGAALGDAWTPTVEKGWTGIFGFVATSMQRGATTFTEDELDEAYDYHDFQ